MAFPEGGPVHRDREPQVAYPAQTQAQPAGDAVRRQAPARGEYERRQGLHLSWPREAAARSGVRRLCSDGWEGCPDSCPSILLSLTAVQGFARTPSPRKPFSMRFLSFPDGPSVTNTILRSSRAAPTSLPEADREVGLQRKMVPPHSTDVGAYQAAQRRVPTPTAHACDDLFSTNERPPVSSDLAPGDGPPPSLLLGAGTAVSPPFLEAPHRDDGQTASAIPCLTPLLKRTASFPKGLVNPGLVELARGDRPMFLLFIADDYLNPLEDDLGFGPWDDDNPILIADDYVPGTDGHAATGDGFRGPPPATVTEFFIVRSGMRISVVHLV